MLTALLLLTLSLATAAEPPEAAPVYGTVRVAETGEPVPHATVYLPELERGTLTDARGYFVLPEVPEGRWDLRVSALGYRTSEQRIAVPETGSVRADVALAPQPVEITGVEVRSAGERSAATGAGPPPARITQPELRSLPALAERDVLRAVQTLPSVAAASDFSSALYVRGGSPDQTLVTLDGVELFNPYHLGGLFGAVDPDIVAGVNVQPGAFPAGVGDRLSGVVDIRTRDGGRDRVRGHGAVGMLSSRASLDGPLPGGQGSWLVSGRRTYLDLATDAAYRLGLTSITLPYAFNDAYLKATHPVGENGAWTASAYLNRERFSVPERMRREIGALDMDFGWGSSMAQVGYRHTFAPTLVGEFQAFSTGFHGDFGAAEEVCLVRDGGGRGCRWDHLFDARSRVRSSGASVELTRHGRSHRQRAGIRVDRQRFEHHLTYPESVRDAFIPEFARGDRPTTVAAHVEDEWSATEALALRGGLRLLHAGARGTAWMPRLGARWTISTELSVYAGAGRYAQVMQSLRDEEALGASLLAYDFLAAVDEDQGLMEADDVTVGAVWRRGGTEVRADAYLKRLRGLRLPPVPDDVLSAPMLVTEGFRAATGRARGLELLARHRSGPLDLSLSYALASIHHRAGDDDYPARFERRHTVDALAAARSARWGEGSARLVLGTGQPFTPVTGVARLDPYDPHADAFQPVSRPTLLLGEHNSDRLPGYLRLDVAARRTLERRWFGADVTLTPYLQVLNALNTRNVLAAVPEGATSGPPVLNYAPQLPFLPTIGVEWQW